MHNSTIIKQLEHMPLANFSLGADEVVCLTAQDSIESVLELAAANPSIARIYVVDADFRLQGAISVSDLFCEVAPFCQVVHDTSLIPATVFQHGRRRVADLAKPVAAILKAGSSMGALLQLVAQYNCLEIPLVDTDGRLLQIVNARKLLEDYAACRRLDRNGRSRPGNVHGLTMADGKTGV